MDTVLHKETVIKAAIKWCRFPILEAANDIHF
jgi:hypothetical protein